jgi:hypothetical protein
MFERIATGWALTKQAVNVLRLDKELLLFPILSGLCCLLVLASFFVPAYAFGIFDALIENRESQQGKILLAAIGFAFYFVNYFVMVFFNSALVGCSVIRLKGGDPTVSDGFATAFSRLPQIAAWAAVAATVGVILKSFENKDNKLGQIVIGLIGAAWTMLTFFVVPIIVIEQLGPFAAIKRSASLLTDTWGESVSSTSSLRLITFLLSLLGVLPIVGGGFLIANQMAAIGIPLLLVGVLILLAISLISSALNSIILAALYIYAVEGRTADNFDPTLIEHAFASK